MTDAPPPRPLTRRRLVQVLGALGGAGVAWGALEALDLARDARDHTKPFTPPGRSDFHLQGRVNGTTVLVLGGGDAGLVSMYELEKAGYRCELLEARDRPGGRAWTVRGGDTNTDLQGVTQTAEFSEGQYMNPGAARIPQHHTTLDYCRELGVPIEVFVNANPDAFVLLDEAEGASGPLTGSAVRRRAAKADLDGYVAELLAKSSRRGALDDVLTGDDREALVEYLRSFGRLTGRGRYAGSASRGYAEPPGAADQAGLLDLPYALPDLLAAGVGLPLAFDQEWDQAMPMFQPVGGMDRIPHALSAAIQGTQRFGAAVQGIELTSDGVEVDYVDADGNDQHTRAEYCICTIPPQVLRTIPHNLGDDVTTALDGLTPAPVGKLGLEFKRRFWEEDDRIYGGISTTNLETGPIFYPSAGYHGERGVLIGYYSFFSGAEQLGALSPEERTERAIEVGSRIHGSAYRDELASSFSVHWDAQEFSEGGWIEWLEDRAGSPAYRTLLQPVERLYFAGDHLSHLTAWQHGAIESARYVVTQLHERALAS